jgi:microtubule-associated protein-like 6
VSRGPGIDGRVIRRSIARGDADAPAAKISGLELEFVHGYRGCDTRNNLVYDRIGNAIYHAAGAAIIYNLKSGEQSFYLEHNDDILALALNKCPRYENVVATGQIGAKPTINIWESTSLQTLSIIEGFHEVGISSLCFSADGKTLLSLDVGAAVGIAVYNWRTGALLSSHQTPHHRIFVAEFRPETEAAFVTCGVKHIKFWSVVGNQLKASRGLFTTKFPKQTMLSVAFGEPGITFSGAMSGAIFVWSSNQIISVIPELAANEPELAGHFGPIFSMCTVRSSAGEGGSGNLVLTGGKDGVVRVWTADMAEMTEAVRLPAGTVIRSVFKSGGDGRIIVGSKQSDVYVISEAREVRAMVHGHGEGELWGLATHPVQPVFASGSDDETLRLWSLETHQMIHTALLPSGCRSVAFSADGCYVAAGLVSGEILLFAYDGGGGDGGSSTDHAPLTLLQKHRDRGGPIHDLKFSPKGMFLAVASNEDSVDFYSFLPDAGQNALTRMGYTGSLGAGAYAVHIDWLIDQTGDPSFVQVDTSTHQRLCFDAPQGNSVPFDPRMDWDSWSSILADDVRGIWPLDAKKARATIALFSFFLPLPFSSFLFFSFFLSFFLSIYLFFFICFFFLNFYVRCEWSDVARLYRMHHCIAGGWSQVATVFVTPPPEGIVCMCAKGSSGI